MHLPDLIVSYQTHFTEIELLRQRIDELEAEATSPRAVVLDGLPHGPRSDPDRIGRAVSRIDELRRQEAELSDTVRAEYAALDAAINRVTVEGKPENVVRVRHVLRLRYLDGKTAKDVSDALWMDMPDFVEKEESYLRRTFLLQKTGVKALGEILEKGGGN